MIIRLVFLEHFWLVFHSVLANTCLKLKVETLYSHADCGQHQQQKHQNDVMQYLFFYFEHIQQINLNFLLLILDMYMSVTFTNGKKRNYIGYLNGEEVFSKVFLYVFFGLFFCFLFSWRLLVLFLRRLVSFLLVISVTFL